MKSRLFLLITLIVSIVSLSACVYRLDIPQGNLPDADLVAQLEVGMTKTQVEFLLGRPSIIDLYRPDTWHYIHYLKSGENGNIEKQVMTILFDSGKITSIKQSS